MGTPIINLPQTGRNFPTISTTVGRLTNIFLAVMGLHAIKEKPVAIDGKVEIRPVRSRSILLHSESN